MEYTSTRDSSLRVGAAEALLKGLAPDGGLFVPVTIPRLDFSTLMYEDYNTLAFNILRLYFPDFSEDFLKSAIAATYGENFGGKAGYLQQVKDNTYALELWHGPTCAFKDYALQLMPKLLVEARRMRDEKGTTIILVATSGDTGSAALSGYSNLPGIKIAVFYPQGGTSTMQRLQMTTQTAENVAVYAVRGNFDDAQRGVKTAFTNSRLAAQLAQKDAALSSANSINWGRLAPQIVYYATSYQQLCREGAVRYGDPVDFCVPTGNFGDIMAGWYAKQMGLPVGRLVCASNKNNVLSDFLTTGHYNTKRNFFKTSSPSMDILVSSNLERLLWHISGSDAEIRGWMNALAEKGEYEVPASIMDTINTTFASGWADEGAVFDEIKRQQDDNRYLCDPHTAVAFRVWQQDKHGATPGVILSTASPFKFSQQVLGALGATVPDDEQQALKALEAYSGQQAPVMLSGLFNKTERFTGVIDTAHIPEIPLEL